MTLGKPLLRLCSVFFNHLNYHLNDVCGSSYLSSSLFSFLALKCPISGHCKQLKKNLKLTHINCPAAKKQKRQKNKKKNKLTDTQSNPVEQKVVKSYSLQSQTFPSGVGRNQKYWLYIHQRTTNTSPNEP